jgi:hypothetical protein
MNDRYKGPPAEPEMMADLLPSMEQMRAEAAAYALTTWDYGYPNPPRDPAPLWVPAYRADRRETGLPLIPVEWASPQSYGPPIPLWVREQLAVLEWLNVNTGRNPAWEAPGRPWDEDMRRTWYENMTTQLGLLGDIDHAIEASGLNPVLDRAEKTRDYSEAVRLLLAMAEAAARPAEEEQIAPSEPQPRQPERKRRGPALGTIARYGESDDALFQEIDESLEEGPRPGQRRVTLTGVTLKLAKEGRIAGENSKPESVAKRLRDRYKQRNMNEVGDSRI